MSDTLQQLREMVACLPDATLDEVHQGIETVRLLNGHGHADQWPRRQVLAQSYFDNGPDLLSVLDRKNNLWVINQTWSRVLGWSFEEFDAQRHTLMHPDDMGSSAAVIEQLGSIGYVDTYVNRYRHKDGHYVSICWSGRMVNGVIYSSGRVCETSCYK